MQIRHGAEQGATKGFRNMLCCDIKAKPCKAVIVTGRYIIGGKITKRLERGGKHRKK